ncbi:hypothetical protein VNO77_00320 [Canavalia gladiata]|uniref:Uncharacterized protein n=1 Tax=Canavalia gladiata TaxID=3824 RepID=A0AAN9MTZ6_CANGL
MMGGLGGHRPFLWAILNIVCAFLGRDIGFLSGRDSYDVEEDKESGSRDIEGIGSVAQKGSHVRTMMVQNDVVYSQFTPYL